jgi:hypothetical protein
MATRIGIDPHNNPIVQRVQVENAVDLNEPPSTSIAAARGGARQG